MVRQRLIQLGNKYFSGRQWPLVAFQPILYFFIFGASTRLWIDPDSPVNFSYILGSEDDSRQYYGIWLALGILGPIISLASWLLVTKCNRRLRFIGLWLRWAADIMVFAMFLSYHVTVAVADTISHESSEEHIFARYGQGSVLFFLACLLIRDIWTLVLTERMASQIHRDKS